MMNTPIMDALEKLREKTANESDDVFGEIVLMFAGSELSFQETGQPLMVEDLEKELESVDQFRKSRLLSNMFNSLMAMDNKRFAMKSDEYLDMADIIYFYTLFTAEQQQDLTTKLFNGLSQIVPKSELKDVGPAERAKFMQEISNSMDERAIRRGEISREEVEKADMELRQETKTLVEMAALAEKRGATREQAVGAVLNYLFEKDGVDPNSEQAKSYLKLIFGDEYKENGGSDNGNDERRD